MKNMWKGIRVLIALVVVVGAIYWSYQSIRDQSYSGTAFRFDLGKGGVTLTNLGDEPATLKLIGTGTSGAFTVTSDNADLAGSSTREGTGRNATHLLEVELPPGTSTLQLTRGDNVAGEVDATGTVNVVVTPMTSNQVRTQLIVTVVIVLVALYYASRTLEHQWIKPVRGRLLGRTVQSDRASA